GPEPVDPAAVEAAKKFLAEAPSAWFSAKRDGMKSVAASGKLESEGGGLFGGGRKGRGEALKGNTVEIAWSWSEAGGEDIRIPDGGKRGGALQKALKKRVNGIWRGVAGEPYGPFPEQLIPALKTEDGKTEVRFIRKKDAAFVLRFQGEAKLPDQLEAIQGKRKTVTTFTFKTLGEKEKAKTILVGLQQQTEVGNQIKEQSGFSWENFRDVNGRPLPTLVKMDLGGKSVTLRFTYTLVNGSPAKVKEAGKEEVKDLAKALAKAFGSNSIVEKQEAISLAKDVGTDLAAQLLAKYIYDKDTGLEVVKALASMGKRSATSALISALGRTKKNPQLNDAVILALGAIGDPKAVKPLSKNIWGGAGKEGWHHTARLKVRALGQIRDRTSVDELIGMTDDSRKRWGHAMRGEVLQALRKLTGQNFRTSREWRDWWKKNRSSFTF
ncbi:MAG: HEAT repeat domain-containing protein, partial [Planctomycetota bacterium]